MNKTCPGGTLRAVAGRFALAFALFTSVVAQASRAEMADDFYKGKQIRLIVSTGSGGGYDSFARIMAMIMPHHIPGQPTIIVENMDGASGLKATNYVYNSAPRDGTVIASTHSSIPTAPLLSPQGAQFDVNKLSWIGSITKDPFVGFVWYTSKIQTLEDAKTTPVVMAGSAIGAAGTDYAIIAKKFFGFKFKIVNGYASSGDMNLAMEKGEADGTFATAWGSLKNLNADWLRDGKVRILVQHGFEKSADLPNVPLFLDQAKNDADRQALDILLARQEFSKPYFGPPGVPAARLDILRRAFDATIRDPMFLAAAKQAHLDVDSPMTGEELAALTAKLSQTPSSVIRRIEAAFADFRNGRQ